MSIQSIIVGAVIMSVLLSGANYISASALMAAHEKRERDNLVAIKQAVLDQYNQTQTLPMDVNETFEYIGVINGSLLTDKQNKPFCLVANVDYAPFRINASASTPTGILAITNRLNDTCDSQISSGILELSGDENGVVVTITDLQNTQRGLSYKKAIACSAGLKTYIETKDYQDDNATNGTYTIANVGSLYEVASDGYIQGSAIMDEWGNLFDFREDGGNYYCESVGPDGVGGNGDDVKNNSGDPL
jgi:hypothetical protein